jgi:hypothetical protein
MLALIETLQTNIYFKHMISILDQIGSFLHSHGAIDKVQCYFQSKIKMLIHKTLGSKHTQRSNKHYFTLVLHVFFLKITFSYE